MFLKLKVQRCLGPFGKKSDNGTQISNPQRMISFKNRWTGLAEKVPAPSEKAVVEYACNQYEKNQVQRHFWSNFIQIIKIICFNFISNSSYIELFLIKCCWNYLVSTSGTPHNLIRFLSTFILARNLVIILLRQQERNVRFLTFLLGSK